MLTVLSSYFSKWRLVKIDGNLWQLVQRLITKYIERSIYFALNNNKFLRDY